MSKRLRHNLFFVLFYFGWTMSTIADAQSIDFGNVQLTKFKDSTETLTNPLPVPVTVTSTTIKGNPSDFSIIAGGAPFTVPPGGTHTITLRFAPSVLGTSVDTLVIVGTFPGSPSNVQLLGNGIPLPVELKLFTVEKIVQGILLRWTTESETNNFGFEIERARVQSAEDASKDRANDSSLRSQEKYAQWQKIGFINGHGTVNIPQSYFFIDQAASNFAPSSSDSTSHLIYRLKQIDHDGTSNYSPTIRVVIDQKDIHRSAALQLTAYPNPFSTSVTVNTIVPAMNSNRLLMIVYDVLGKKVADLSPAVRSDWDSPKNQFEFTQLLPIRIFPASGMYILRVTDQEKTSSVVLNCMK